MARISDRPRYWLTPCVKIPPAIAALHVIEDSSQDVDHWRDRRPEVPKGSAEGVKFRLTLRPYKAGDTIRMTDVFTSGRAMERFKACGFAALPEITPEEKATAELPPYD